MKKFLISLLALTILTGAFSGTSFAAGSASLSLSPASGTYNNGSTINVGVYENGSDVNTVTVSLNYDSSKLQLLSTSCAGVFSNKIGSGSTITCYVNPGDPAVSGSQLVANASFKAVVGSGTAAVTFGSNSAIASNGTNVWSGSTSGGTYTLATPASQPSQPAGGKGAASTGTTSTGSTSNAAGSGSKSSKTSTGNSSASNSSTTAKNSKTTTGSVAGASVTVHTPKSVGKKATAKLAISNSSATEQTNGFQTILAAVMVILIAVGLIWTLRNRTSLKLSSIKVFSKNK